jgi:hypothetical protein
MMAVLGTVSQHTHDYLAKFKWCLHKNQEPFNDHFNYAKNLTDNWPVPTEALTELDSVKSSHEVIPLNVIDNGIQVLPLDVQGVLRNALVEATFYMEYSKYHSSHKLNACTEGNMKQIIVLHHSNQ